MDQRDGRHLSCREADQHRLRFDTVGDREVEAVSLGKVAAEPRHVEPDQLRVPERPYQNAAFGDEEIEKVALRMQHRDHEIVGPVELPSEVPGQDGCSRPAGLVAHQQDGLARLIEGSSASPQVRLGIEQARPPFRLPVVGVVDQQTDVGLGNLPVEVGIGGGIEEAVRPEALLFAGCHIMLCRFEGAETLEPGAFPVVARIEQVGVEHPKSLFGGGSLRPCCVLRWPRARVGSASPPCSASAPQLVHHAADRTRHAPGRRSHQRPHAPGQFTVLGLEFGDPPDQPFRFPRARIA